MVGILVVGGTCKALKMAALRLRSRLPVGEHDGIVVGCPLGIETRIVPTECR